MITLEAKLQLYNFFFVHEDVAYMAQKHLHEDDEYLPESSDKTSAK